MITQRAATILIGLLLSALIHANPVNVETDVVIQPGPGLPSVESLGLTTAELIEQGRTLAQEAVSLMNDNYNNNTSSHSDLEKRLEPTCIYNGYASPENVYACAGYLHNLGTNLCLGGGDGVVLCDARGHGGRNGARVIGNTFTGKIMVSSWCSHVALAVFWMLDNCVDCVGPICGISAHAPAYGNGDFDVIVMEFN